jgi:K+-sensing histidine kinase KdpD
MPALRQARPPHTTGTRILPQDGRDLLFTRFGRLPGSGMRACHVGTGLGLYLGRAYAEAMGGTPGQSWSRAARTGVSSASACPCEGRDVHATARHGAPSSRDS